MSGSLDIEHEQLNWDLLFSVDQGLTWEAIALDLPTTQFSFEWMFPGKTYEKFRIQIVQDNNGVDYHDTNQFDIGPPKIVTVLNDLRFQEPMLFLSSNPVSTSSSVIFNTGYRGLARISVYDQRGKEVLQVFNGVLQPGKNEFPLIPQKGPNYFKPGIYILKIQSRESSEAIRFIYLN